MIRGKVRRRGGLRAAGYPFTHITIPLRSTRGKSSQTHFCLTSTNLKYIFVKVAIKKADLKGISPLHLKCFQCTKTRVRMNDHPLTVHFHSLTTFFKHPFFPLEVNKDTGFIKCSVKLLKLLKMCKYISGKNSWAYYLKKCVNPTALENHYKFEK